MLEVIWPLLLKKAKSVKDAKNICKSFTLGLDTGFQQDMVKYEEFRSGDRLETLNLKGLMNEGQQFSTEWELIELLKDEKISTAKGLIQGLGGELDRLTTVEEMKRPLAELKTDFL